MKTSLSYWKTKVTALGLSDFQTRSSLQIADISDISFFLARPRLTRRCRVPLAAAPASARPAPPPGTARRGTMTSLRRPLPSGARRRPGNKRAGGRKGGGGGGGRGGEKREREASSSGSHGDQHRPCAAAGSR